MVGFSKGGQGEGRAMLILVVLAFEADKKSCKTPAFAITASDYTCTRNMSIAVKMIPAPPPMVPMVSAKAYTTSA